MYVNVCLLMARKLCTVIAFCVVVCHLEGSNKWPDNLTAMQKIKAAFHLKLSQLLQDKCKLTAVPTEQSILINKVHAELVLIVHALW